MIALVDPVPWGSLVQFPSEWRILHGLLRSLLVAFAHSEAPHLHGYHREVTGLKERAPSPASLLSLQK